MRRRRAPYAPYVIIFRLGGLIRRATYALYVIIWRLCGLSSAAPPTPSTSSSCSSELEDAQTQTLHPTPYTPNPKRDELT